MNGGRVAATVVVAAASHRACARRYRRELARDGVLDAPGGVAGSPSCGVIRGTSPSGRRVVGRAGDLVLAGAGLVVLAPAMMAIAAAVRLGDGGSALFVQERVGRQGRVFAMRKFRTMIVGAEGHPIDNVDEHGRSLGPLFNPQHDARVTTVGRVLRRTGLDELPQLFNVVAGEMSLVGPRPALPCEVAAFDTDLRRRETVRPGVTGLWQVLAHDNPSIDVYRRLDLYYVDHRSLIGDVAIIGWTIRQVTARCFGREARAVIVPLSG